MWATALSVLKLNYLLIMNTFVLFPGEYLRCDSLAINIDGAITKEDLASFNAAITILMISYFALGICRPSGVEAALEFVQRCVL